MYQKHLFALLLAGITGPLLAQPAGNLDPLFGNAGKVVTSVSSADDKAYGVAIQPDGKIVVAGYTTNAVTGKDILCIRYNADGSLDNTFGTGGIVSTDLALGSDDIAYDLALQSDGKIVLAGSCDNGSNRDAALIRYKPNGTRDSSFGTNGIVTTNFEASQQDEIQTIKIHAITGNIVVGGSSRISSSKSKPVVARYLPNGTLDNSFNSTGIRLLWITSLDYQYLFSVEDLEVQSNGKITAVGWRDFPGQSWSSDCWAGRINSDGSMDNTFNGDGVETYNGPFNGHDRTFGMILKPDGSFLLGGSGYWDDLRYDFTLFEVTSTGTVTGWDAAVSFASTDPNMAYALAQDVNGKYVMAGSTGSGSSKSFALTRVNTNGTLDNTFGNAGKVTTPFTGGLNECFDIAIQTDNKIVAVGYAGNDIAIARYLGNPQAQLNNMQLVSPANNAVNQNYATLNFNWTDAFGANSYVLEIDTVSDFTGNVQYHSSSVSEKTVTGLLVNQVYYWRVKASDGTNWGNYVGVWKFTTNALENFNLILPANNATAQEFTSLVFDWTNATGASSYKLMWDTDPAFGTNPQTYTGSNSTHTATGLSPNTQYYWRVQAANAGVWGQWSTVWMFTTRSQSQSSLADYATSGLEIFPNPTDGVFYVKALSTWAGSSYTVIDQTGKTVLSGSLQNDVTQINLQTVASGTYFLRMGSTNAVFRIIKN